MKYYKVNPNVSPEVVKQYGFRHNRDIYTYRTIAYTYQSKPTIFVDFIFDSESRVLRYNVVKNNGLLYYPFYDCDVNGYKGDYQNNKVVNTIRATIKKEINNMMKRGILANED